MVYTVCLKGAFHNGMSRIHYNMDVDYVTRQSLEVPQASLQKVKDK